MTQPVDPVVGEREQIARMIRDGSRGRCEVVAYHKVYAVTEAAALELASQIIALRSTPAAPSEQGLKPCPFCGAPAMVEHIADQDAPRWTVGCSDEECVAFQSLTTFARKSEAVAAWSRRSTPAATARAGEVELTREEALRESAYLSGLKAGWNFGIAEDREGYTRSVEARAGYLKPIINARRDRLSAAQEGKEEEAACTVSAAQGTAALRPEGPRPAGWRSVDSAPRERKLLLGYHDRRGNWRTIVGAYYTQLPWAEGMEPYDDDAEYAPEGWYEESETHDFIQQTDVEPTHWMPLPPPPEDAGLSGSKAEGPLDRNAPRDEPLPSTQGDGA